MLFKALWGWYSGRQEVRPDINSFPDRIMIKNKLVRYLLGALLGGLAGLSFCISILPVALQLVGAGDQAYAVAALTEFAPYSALLWAVGGLSVARAGFLKAGMVIMAVVGLSAGLLLVARGIAPQGPFLMAGALSGLVYGLVGGMILGRVLAPTVPD